MRQALFLMADEISKAAIERKLPIPDNIKAGMLVHEQIPFYSKSVGLTHLTVSAIINRLLHEKKIKFKRSEVLDCNLVRNMNLVQHHFQTADGKPFHASELCAFPGGPVESLTHSIMEFFVDEGCNACGYGTIKFEDDLLCPICVGGEVRKKMKAIIGKTFPEGSWHIFSEAIGPEYSRTLLDIAGFNFRHKTSKKFVKAVEAILFPEESKSEEGSVDPESEGLVVEDAGTYVSVECEKLLNTPFPLGFKAKDILEQLKPDTYGEMDFDSDEE